MKSDLELVSDFEIIILDFKHILIMSSHNVSKLYIKKNHHKIN
jgi:hypothetical protein